MIARRPPLAPPTRRRTAPEPVVAMINVVFLLLIFFLMTAQIGAPAPFEIVLPRAKGGDPERAVTLYLSAGGELAFHDLRGEAALRDAATHTPLTVQADARLPAQRLAKVLARLSRAGAQKLLLVTEEAD